MKTKRSVFLMLAILITALLSVLPSSAGAASITDDLPLTVLSAEEQERILNLVKLIKTEAEPHGEIIVSFDVSEQMGILLLTRKDYPVYHIIHMDLDGNVISIFRFNTSGSAGIAWDSSDICLFLVRSSLVVKVSCEGVVKEISVLEYHDYYTGKGWDTLSYRQAKNVTSGRYELKGVLYEHAYSKLVFTDGTTREETTLYDVSTEATASAAVMTLLGIGFSVMVFLVIKDQKEKSADRGDPD